MMKLKLLPPWDDYGFLLVFHSTFAVCNAIFAATDESVWQVRLHGLLMVFFVVCAAISWYWTDEESEVK